MERSTGPHHKPSQQQRIAALQRRLDVLEHRLRLRAAELGEDAKVTLGQLRRALAQRDPKYRGPERRRAVRQGADEARAQSSSDGR